MKYLILILIFSLFSCKSDVKKAEGFQEKAVEMNQENSTVSIDTTSFMEFFERFILNKEFQKARILNPLIIDNLDISINALTNELIFYPKKEFMAFLDSDTLSIFDKNNRDTKQDMIIINFKEKENLKYKFESNQGKWMFAGFDNISTNSLSEKKFVDFLVKFSKDSIYQKSHILFPLEDHSLDDEYEIISQKIEKEKWNHFNLVKEIESLLFLANIDSNNNVRNIYYRGNDNGILVKLTFKIVNNDWFLVKTEDYST